MRGRGRAVAVAVAVAMAMAVAGRVVGIAGWPAGRGRWSGVSLVAGCPGGRMAVAGGRWPGRGRVAGPWPGGRVARWPGGRVAGWPGGQVARWPGGRVGGRVAAALAAVCHPLACQAACLFVHFGGFTHTNQC